MCFVFGFFIALLIQLKTEKAEAERLRKRRKEWKQKREKMCERTKTSGMCPGACEICAWGQSVYEN